MAGRDRRRIKLLTPMQGQGNPLCLAGNQGVHQLISHAQLEPVAGEPAGHADPVATIFRLLCVARGPGALQQQHVPRPVERETQPPGAIGRH
jgi:hypothetical protein